MNDEILQRLVDGELNSDERADVIRQIDQYPDAWRRVALELLHEQLVDRAVNRYVTEPIAQHEPNEPKQAAPASGRFAGVRNLVAIASTLLLMIVIGYWLGQVDRPGGLVNGPRVSAVSGESTMDLADALAKCVTPVPDSFRRDMLLAGYFLTEDQQFRQVALPTGGTIEMPVRQFSIHYLGQDAAFQ